MSGTFSRNTPVGAIDPLGLITWPSRYFEITGPFGEQRGRGVHTGTDIRNPRGEPVFATESGTVISVSHSTRGGNQIVIQNDDGSISGSAHTAPAPGTAAGVRVREGQTIGVSDGSGTTGAGTPVRPHLHQTYRLCRNCPKTDLYEQFRKEQQRERRQLDMERQRLGERKS